MTRWRSGDTERLLYLADDLPLDNETPCRAHPSAPRRGAAHTLYPPVSHGPNPHTPSRSTTAPRRAPNRNGRPLHRHGNMRHLLPHGQASPRASISPNRTPCHRYPSRVTSGSRTWQRGSGSTNPHRGMSQTTGSHCRPSPWSRIWCITRTRFVNEYQIPSRRWGSDASPTRHPTS